jgi:hypothetical protein
MLSLLFDPDDGGGMFLCNAWHCIPTSMTVLFFCVLPFAKDFALVIEVLLKHMAAFRHWKM